MKYQLQKVISLFFVCFLTTCSSTSEKIAMMSDEELIQELTSRSYQFYNPMVDKKNRITVLALKIKGKGQYRPGDLLKVCSIKKLKYLSIESGELPDFSLEEIRACKNSNVDTILIDNIKLNNFQICEIAKGLKAPKIRIDFNYIPLTDSELTCISQIQKLDTFIVWEGAKITDEGMCQLSQNAKNLTFLRMEDIDFLTKKSTDCMLNLPSLKDVMLKRWKHVSESQMEKFVSAYEAKHKRKIEASIYDPVGYEKP
ncbi:hypothetical protein ND856_09865 [Leptospira bandrabouensis]|uniref:hypothetical protein n=1 Tax=Leptospira bandrabouensis TaxID=2484903 RepID=UPI00223D0413|nr:hypothetical protein [Leptospira bandrabouensis]MCW7457671.1 hypothetical protein [Leptospira bandrabouensis]MCW7477589.1 hypothetical protein [Leptospira bandrabouensis]MCW7485271.1 hypothetical protein [Leptospira bandrabouensis]